MKSEKLEVKNLIFNYGVKNILNDISFEVPKGDFVAIVGKSGAGKSTLLRCLNLLNRPKSGEINIAGEDIINSNKSKLKLIRRDIAFIFQDYNVLDNLYTIENVLTPYLVKKSVLGLLLGYTKKEYNEGVDFLKQVGLEDEAFKKSKYLSGGQKQRLFIARALYRRPGILFMDEATSALDTKSEMAINQAIKNLNITRVIIAHRETTVKSADRRIIIGTEKVS